jgi:hypothetical protein
VINRYLLVIDGRYRDFLNMLFALPVGVIRFGMWFDLPIKNKKDRLQWLTCICAIAIATYCWMLEPRNVSAMIWLFLNLILALTNLPVKNVRFSDKGQ